MADNIKLDVDFTQDPRYVAGYNGVGESLMRLSRYEDAVDIIPESQWPQLYEARKGRRMRDLVTRIFDQGQEGSCVGNQAAQAHQVLQALELGKDAVVQLSAISLYKRIGSSANSGAYIGDAMDEIMERGVLPLDNPENRTKFGSAVMPHTGFRTPFPSNWQPTAAKFKMLEAYRGRSRAELITALFKGHPVGVGRAGHSILYLDPVYDGRDLFAEYANSWTPQWGDNGFGRDSERMIRSSSGEFIVYRATNTVR